MSTNSQRSNEQQTWFAVQRHQEQVFVVEQRGGYPSPDSGQAAVRVVATGICGADVRVCTGNKVATGDPRRYTTLGHEGIGVVTELSVGTFGLQVGDHIVILPHYFPSEHSTHCPSVEVVPSCIGAGHTLHMGWDIPGVFADALVAPSTHLVRIEQAHLERANRLAPDLGAAVFAMTEPMLCTLSAYHLAEQQTRELLQQDLPTGRALVIGCGPIGILHALALRSRGFEVWFADTVSQRASLARRCLGGGSLYDADTAGAFDLVIVAASSANAIRMGEALVKNRGVLYLFAGLNSAERESTDLSRTLSYERLHRSAQGFVTRTHGKTILYVGHSGYFECLAEQAIAAVASNAAELDRAITGVIRGWISPCIESRVSQESSWSTPDRSPAIVSVLQGTDLRSQHGKLIVDLRQQA